MSEVYPTRFITVGNRRSILKEFRCVDQRSTVADQLVAIGNKEAGVVFSRPKNPSTPYQRDGCVCDLKQSGLDRVQ